jgi:hypothetical protein
MFVMVIAKHPLTHECLQKSMQRRLGMRALQLNIREPQWCLRTGYQFEQIKRFSDRAVASGFQVHDHPPAI